MVKALRNPRYFNLIYQVLLVLVFVQQIYYPQEYKYVHLALVFIRMIISEGYNQTHRYFKFDEYFILAILVTSFVSVIEVIYSVQLGLVYLLSLTVAVVIMGTFLKTMIDDSKNGLGSDKFHPKHIEMLKKGRLFTNGLLVGLIGINVLILFYVLYEIIKLLS
ncbi:hypothetical protein [Fusibacter bizertensis]